MGTGRSTGAEENGLLLLDAEPGNQSGGDRKSEFDSQRGREGEVTGDCMFDTEQTLCCDSPILLLSKRTR